MNICWTCCNDEGICKTLLYRKWYAYMRESCTLYLTLEIVFGWLFYLSINRREDK